MLSRSIRGGVKIWEHYRSCLCADFARVGYLCSQNPTIIKHVKDPDNRDPKNLLAVDHVIECLILKKNFSDQQEWNNELARLIDKFWKE